jgi:hypothetical protein
MTAIIPLMFAATLGNPIVVTQWEYYPVREQARGYLGRYPDQPLVVDNDLPEDADRTGILAHPVWCEYNSMADIDAMYAEGKSYGLDGFAFFPARYRKLLWRAKDSSVKGMLTVPIVNFWRDRNTRDDIASIAKAVEYGCSAKHDGKTIVLSYWTDRFNKPDQLAAKLKLARERVGDKFLYMAATSWSDGLWECRSTGKVSEKRMEKMKNHFREMLRVADGIILDGTMSNHAVTNQTRVFAGGYHKLMTRTARSVVDEPEFKGKKLLGFTLSIGHQNAYHQNFTANSMGTRTLRESFEAAIAGDPDVILIPEWGELNESTGWKPTLYNGYSTKRLFRYYDAVLRRRPQTVMEGDDVSVPNIILSYRKSLSPGEWLYFEAVNVPDGSRTGNVEVSLELSDPDGRVLASLPAKTLREDALDVAWWDVHSDELAPLARAVDVRLRWRKGSGAAVDVAGFHPIDLAPANSWNLKDVKQPLRDLAPVTCREFAAKGGKIAADIACATPIRHAMLCGNGWIQYIHNSASPCSRFREDDGHAVFAICSTRAVAVKGDFSYSVAGVPDAEWLCWKREGRGERFAVDWISLDSENVYLRIPKESLADAKLTIDYGGVMPKAEVRLSEAYRLGAYAVGCANSTNAECAVVRFGLQSRYPSALNAKECRFAVAPDADRRSMTYHLQVVDMAGRTWRSRPIVAEAQAESVETAVYAALKGRVVSCRLPRSRVPRLEYDFSPEAGDVMRPIGGERHFFGMLGSQAALATLWNRGSSLEGAFPRESPFWKNSADPHPRREKGDDGRWVMVFDGVDDMVSFPQETVPQWAAASIVLEFNQSTSGAERVEAIFTARYDNRVGLYETTLDKGEIVITGESSDNVTSSKPFEFRTGLVAKPGAWHVLNVRHTGSSMVVTLDGRSASQEVPLPAVFMNTAVLGGSPKKGALFFTGKVRKLVIDHASGSTILPILPF